MNGCLMSKVDKYGRGSAAANGEGFVDLAPGDTFAALEINQDAKSRSTPRGAISEDLNSAPFQDLTSQLTDMVSYYVGDVNRTHPKFVGRDEMFSTGRTVELLDGIERDFCAKLQAPKFSIIIPVYNVAPYLRECLDSVLAQTFTDWEAICVDDGSTDGSGAILDEYAAKDGRFRVIHQKNAGVSAARNAALDVAKGEWIGFLDADDKVLTKWLESVFHASSLYSDVDWIRAGYKDWYGGSQITEWRAGAEPIIEPGIHLDIPNAGWDCLSRIGMPFLNFFKRRSIGGVRFDVGLRYAEDICFTAELLGQLGVLVEINSEQYLYRIRAGSAAHGLMEYSYIRRALGSMFRSWEKWPGKRGSLTRLINKHVYRSYWSGSFLTDIEVRELRVFLWRCWHAKAYSISEINGWRQKIRIMLFMVLGFPQILFERFGLSWLGR